MNEQEINQGTDLCYHCLSGLCTQKKLDCDFCCSICQYHRCKSYKQVKKTGTCTDRIPTDKIITEDNH